MAHVTDQEFVNRLLVATLDNKIEWQPTAVTDQYTASFAGKWTVEVLSFFQGLGAQTGPPIHRYALILKDASGEILLRIDSDQEPRVAELHELARRRALKVDEALEDLLRELDEEQP